MKQLKTIFVILFLIIGITGCEMNETDLLTELSGGLDTYGSNMSLVKGSMPKATGSVEFLWKGGDKGSDMGNKPENLLAFFTFDAHERINPALPMGEILYQVKWPDLTLHREIKAVVTGVKVIGSKAWFVGVVVSDSKGCSGNSGGGHDSDCSDSSGGCGDETDGHDGGCSDSGTDEGGCSDGGTDEGGCTDGGTDEGGCTDGGSGGMGGESDMGGGSPGGSMGNPLSGKKCRIGQLIAVKVHDVGTPGINDGLTWKWFSPEAAFVPTVLNLNEWPHLCKKVIVEGNLVVHN